MLKQNKKKEIVGDKKTGSNILKSMGELKNKINPIGYGCHTDSPYRDGYGDSHYGDYEDAV